MTINSAANVCMGIMLHPPLLQVQCGTPLIWTSFGERKHEEGVHISEVSVFQGQNRLFLGKKNRHPYYRCVLISGALSYKCVIISGVSLEKVFHCTIQYLLIYSTV